MLSILFDGMIALLCCIGLVSLVYVFCVPRRRPDVLTAGVIAGADIARVQAWIRPMRRVAQEVVIIGDFGEAARELELLYHHVTVLTPEQAADYFVQIKK